MNPHEILRRPILTEKSNYQADALHRYTFEVDGRANKIDVRSAVETIFNVTVVDVNMITVRGKKRRRPGKGGAFSAALEAGEYNLRTNAPPAHQKRRRSAHYRAQQKQHSAVG